MRTLMAMLAMTALLAVPTAAQITSPQLSNANPPRILSAPQAQQRRNALLQANGVTPPPQGLREITTVSVLAPISGSAHFEGFRGNYHPEQRLMSFDFAGSNLELVFRADAGVRFLVDCVVGGPIRTMAFSHRGTNGVDVVTTVPVAAERVGFVTQALGTAGQQRVRLSSEQRWSFYSCEIAPIR